MIPERWLVHCIWCGMALHSERRGTYRHGTGWAMNRKAGGSNSLSLAAMDRQWACTWCIDERAPKHRKQKRDGGKVLCTFCGEKIGKLQLGNYEQVSGWIPRPVPHSIALPIRLGVYACGDCIDRQRNGISIDQLSLDL